MKINTVKPNEESRSPKWPALRRKFLKGKVCAVCENTKKLEAHHVQPFHLFPARELDPTNLIPLCEGNKVINCHCMIGHLGDFESYNIHVVPDARALSTKIKSRPK